MSALAHFWGTLVGRKKKRKKLPLAGIRRPKKRGEEQKASTFCNNVLTITVTVARGVLLGLLFGFGFLFLLFLGGGDD